MQNTNTPATLSASYRGQIQLGNHSIDCYVLDNGERVISLRATVKAIANRDRGDLAEFIGISALKSFINKDLILAEVLEFSIPGTQFKGRGIKSSHFENLKTAGIFETLEFNFAENEFYFFK